MCNGRKKRQANNRKMTTIVKKSYGKAKLSGNPNSVVKQTSNVTQAYMTSTPTLNPSKMSVQGSQIKSPVHRKRSNVISPANSVISIPLQNPPSNSSIVETKANHSVTSIISLIRSNTTKREKTIQLPLDELFNRFRGKRKQGTNSPGKAATHLENQTVDLFTPENVKTFGLHPKNVLRSTVKLSLNSLSEGFNLRNEYEPMQIQ